jgi:hypothetical protein
MATKVFVLAIATKGLQLLVQSSNVAHSQGYCEPIIQKPMTPEFDVLAHNIEHYPLVVFDLVLS